jgi:hypothetical protein
MIRIRTLILAILLVAIVLAFLPKLAEAYRRWTWVDPHITTIGGTTACTHQPGQCPDQPRANR